MARFTASGNFAGCAVPSTTMGLPPRLLALRCGKAYRGMRIDDNPRVLEQPVHGRRRLLAGDAMGREPFADGRQYRGRNAEATALAQIRHGAVTNEASRPLASNSRRSKLLEI